MLDETTLLDERARAPESYRIAAKSIDLGVALLLLQIDSVVATGLGIGYWLIGDAFGFGQSLGKKLLRLRTIHPETYEPCSLQGAALRNAHLALPLVFLQFSLFFQIIGILIGLFAAAYEIQLLYRDEYGVRLGDILAETEVIRLDAMEGETGRSRLRERRDLPESVVTARK